MRRQETRERKAEFSWVRGSASTPLDILYLHVPTYP